MIQIAIMGFGVVGSGVVEVIEMNRQGIEEKAGKKINIKKILDLKDFSNSPLASKFTKDFSDIENDKDIQIVVEAMGGFNPAYDFVKRCLLSGKSVVTSNKELVAEKGDQLLKIAKENNLNFLFEASVGGGIPIIRPLDQCLAANKVTKIAGILNGTTNFILTKMVQDSMPFDDALKMAMDLGYAESDPTDDVDGHDACRKICILASLAFGSHVYPEQVHTKGIRDLSIEDIKYAEAWGGVVKLCGSANIRDDGKIDCIVAPMFVSNKSQLANINDAFNGILVRGNAVGDVVFYGQGAGKLPTASAVVADIIDGAKHIENRKRLDWDIAKDNYVAHRSQRKCAFFLRLLCGDPSSTHDELEKALGKCSPIAVGEGEELAIVTPVILEETLDEALANLKYVEIISRIRIADF